MDPVERARQEQAIQSQVDAQRAELALLEDRRSKGPGPEKDEQLDARIADHQRTLDFLIEQLYQLRRQP